MIKSLNGEERNMVTLQKIDELADLWDKTKDPKYKDLWYKYIKEFVNGLNTIERRTVSSGRSNKRDDQRYRVIK